MTVGVQMKSFVHRCLRFVFCRHRWVIHKEHLIASGDQTMTKSFQWDTSGKARGYFYVQQCRYCGQLRKEILDLK